MNEFDEQPEQPAILIHWNEARKGMQLAIDMPQVGNWDFVVALLEQAVAEADSLEEIPDDEGAPALALYWSDQFQSLRLQVNHTQVRNEAMVEMLLGIARDMARFNANLGRAAMAQQQHAEAQQNARIAQQIRRGIG